MAENQNSVPPGTDAPPCGSRDVAGLVAAASLSTVESNLRRAVDLALHGDPADVEPWVCIGCGADSPRKIRPCDCPSQLVFLRGELRRCAEYRVEVGPHVPIPVPAAQLLALLDAMTADQKTLKVIHDAAFAVRHSFGGRMSEVSRVFEHIVRVSTPAKALGGDA